MALKKWQICFSFTALAVATGAMGDAASAPDAWKLEKIHAGSRLIGMLPYTTKVDPKKPTPNQFEFHFAGGALIPAGQALDPSTITSGNDPRLVNDKVTCSAFLERNSVPVTADLDDAPEEASRTYTLTSGTTFKLQQASFAFSTSDGKGKISHNILVCYKVGEKLLTVHDVHVAMGPKFGIQLPEDESLVKSTDASMLAILGGASGHRYGPSSQDDDSSASKGVVKPGAKPDAVSDFADNGDFVDPRAGHGTTQPVK